MHLFLIIDELVEVLVVAFGGFKINDPALIVFVNKLDGIILEHISSMTSVVKKHVTKFKNGATYSNEFPDDMAIV